MSREPDGTLLTESVHRILQEEILAGEIEPGAPLRVPTLAARLNVSRSPVRESVQRLIHEGLAVYTPNAGARVAVIDDAMMRALLSVREVLEGLAADQAAAHTTDVDLRELEAMVVEQEGLLDGPPDARRDRELDRAFHARVCALSGNVPLGEVLHRLHLQSYLHRSAGQDRDGDRRFAATEHRRILDSVEAGDAVGAGAAARAHVAGLCVRLMRRPD